MKNNCPQNEFMFFNFLSGDEIVLLYSSLVSETISSVIIGLIIEMSSAPAKFVPTLWKEKWLLCGIVYSMLNLLSGLSVYTHTHTHTYIYSNDLLSYGRIWFVLIMITTLFICFFLFISSWMYNWNMHLSFVLFSNIISIIIFTLSF